MIGLRAYRNIYDNGIIFLYRGELTFDLITSFIEVLEKRIHELENDKKVLRKFYSVTTESVQNLYYHMAEIENDPNIHPYQGKTALIMVKAMKRFFSIYTANYVTREQAEEIQKRIDEINETPKSELRGLYKKVLNQERKSEKGTGGLGFIEIARKSQSKLIYKFHPVSEHYQYFVLRIMMRRSPVLKAEVA